MHHTPRRNNRVVAVTLSVIERRGKTDLVRGQTIGAGFKALDLRWAVYLLHRSTAANTSRDRESDDRHCVSTINLLLLPACDALSWRLTRSAFD